MLNFYKAVKRTGLLQLKSLCLHQKNIPLLLASGYVPHSILLVTAPKLFSSYRLLVLLLLNTAFLRVYAQTPPSGFSSVAVSAQWNGAVGFTFTKDGSKMFVWEKAGKVWVVVNNQKQLMLDISQEVGNWHDHGMLGFALHPDFDVNGYFYLLYVVDRHHLLRYGTSTYSATTNEYFNATIGRVTRYTATKTTNGYSVNTASRKVLLGETKSTGIPIMSITHGVGTLLFGADGTLLVSCGDGASPAGDTGGSVSGSYAVQALADGIITSKENVGAFRSQLPEAMNGKILRIDPETGNGIAGNPFYESARPRSARSRVWALGLRNPYRMTLKPGTGSKDRNVANPGTLYIGDVGASTWEELNVVTNKAMNLGWPLYEGLDASSTSLFTNTKRPNYYAPNPLYGINGCTQPYFYFQDLIKQATASGTATFSNPCNTSQGIPASVKTFVHNRPIIDWRHFGGPARVGIFNGETASAANIGAAGSPVPGPQFGGGSSTAGVFYTGNDFPSVYKNTYFHGDYGDGWIRNIVVDANNKPVAVKNFINSGASVVAMATHPVTGGLYYIHYGSEIRKINYGANRSPIAVATVDKTYGISPLTVQFTGNKSLDPEGLTLSYEWNFGDGSPVSTLMNPSHTFSAAAGIPVTYTVTLKVKDRNGVTASTSLRISVNNTPPVVTITSPVNNSIYSVSAQSSINLRASVSDKEHSSTQLHYQWQTILHHNTHNHPGPIDTNPETSAILSPEGCDEAYFYLIRLTVTDRAGLSTTKEVRLYPNCNISNASATAQNSQVRLNWTNPGNFDEIMIVAKAGSAITGTPSGDGSAYWANLSFNGSSTLFNGGKVVYKGRTSPQTVTNLNNNTTYFFKVFTRKGSSWSSGVQLQAIPFEPVVREYWANITGTAVSAIPLHVAPTSTSQLSLFESPANAADNYGSRIRGFIHAPVSGNYIFWIAGDDNCELWLSTDANPANKRKIAFVSGWTGAREWTKFASQRSASIALQAGQKYYIEALHKEGMKGDNLAVGWQLPNSVLERPVPGGRLSPFAGTCTATGTILREYWANVTGTAVSAIPLSTRPTSASQLSSFESPANIGDNYGQRIRGYVCPPATGNYTFYIAGDDNSELFLSTDANPANKRKIASITGWTHLKEWTRYASQKSAVITLQAGRKYYIEALQKEVFGRDHLAVGWMVPNTSAIAVIPGARLSPFAASTARTTAEEELTQKSDQKNGIQAYPNPFSSEVTIAFVVPQTGDAIVEMYNANGSLVKTIFKGKAEAGSVYKVAFDGSHLPSGLYLAKVRALNYVDYKKLILAK